MREFRRAFVERVYGDHNRSRSVMSLVRECIEDLRAGEVGLNVGAGRSPHLHPAIWNYDLSRGESIDCVGRAEMLPFRDDTFSLVVSQETLEHVKDPFRAVREIYRTLRPGGRFYCQVPFIIGYHPGPTDYWRFTKEGIRELVRQAGFSCETVEISVGPATGLYRILVEFLATARARLIPPAYLPAKGGFALALYPLKWGDTLLSGGPERDRIAGGYCLVARKPDRSEQGVER
jgi:SAM-dependent methyltransferase